MIAHRGLSLLQLLLLVDREDDEFGLVLFEALHVLLNGLVRLVSSPNIHSDANGSGKSLV